MLSEAEKPMAPFSFYLRSRMYLDIETTGLSPTRTDYNIVWWSATVGGIGLQENTCLNNFERWQASSELVTYNGKRFDEPFLVEHFGVEKPQNIDLCQVGRKQGLRGGLKKICENCRFVVPPI